MFARDRHPAARGHCRPEMYFVFIDCWFDDLRREASRIPVSKFASGRCDRRAVVLSYGGFVSRFETAKRPLDRGKAFSSYEIWDALTSDDPADRQSSAQLP
jgi:hypothetical protein